MKNIDKTVLVIVAIVAALGFLGIVVMEPIFVSQHQAVASAPGCLSTNNSRQAFTHSQGRCAH